MKTLQLFSLSVCSYFKNVQPRIKPLLIVLVFGLIAFQLSSCKNLFYIKNDVQAIANDGVKLTLVSLTQTRKRALSKAEREDVNEEIDFFVSYPVTKTFKKSLLESLIAEFNQNDYGIEITPLTLSEAVDIVAAASNDESVEQQTILPAKLEFFSDEMVFFSSKMETQESYVFRNIGNIESSSETPFNFQAHIFLELDPWAQSGKGRLKVFTSKGKLVWAEEIDITSGYIPSDSLSPYALRNAEFGWQIKEDADHHSEITTIYSELGKSIAIQFKESLAKFF